MALVLASMYSQECACQGTRTEPHGHNTPPKGNLHQARDHRQDEAVCCGMSFRTHAGLLIIRTGAGVPNVRLASLGPRFIFLDLLCRSKCGAGHAEHSRRHFLDICYERGGLAGLSSRRN